MKPRSKSAKSGLFKPKKPGVVISAKEFFAAKAERDDATVRIHDIDVEFTNLGKVYWPKEGYTKFDLLKYYFTISKTILPYLKDRPLILKRYPNGIQSQMFYQHNLDNAPGYIDIFPTHEGSSGKLVHNPVANNLAALLYLVNLGTITQNPWFSRTNSISKPDYVAFDLDPGDNATFDQVKRIAKEVKNMLDEEELVGYPKTSGSSGIHIYVPIKPTYTYKQLVPYLKKLATIVAERNPKDATVKRMTQDRKSTQVYVDYLQNIEGKTLASPYSIREKPGAPVSAPLEWKEITSNLTIEQFTIENMAARIKKKGDLFAPVLKKKQAIKI